MHALSARPLKNGWRGRGSDTYADETIKINPISLCSHPDTHPNFNREVRHSPTWHSSESESALERFEPVAMVQQLLDGRGSVFAPVAARRQKVFKRGKHSSFCPFRSFRTSEKNSEREESYSNFSFIVLFRDEKYQKSARRTRAVLLPNHWRRARVSRASHAWRVRAARGRAKIGGFALSAISCYHACEHITRKSRADSCTHCLHAR